MAGSEPILNGYVTVRPFGDMFIPVPVQNMLLRNYCTTKGFKYALPLGEHKYQNCYMQLFATINLFKTEGKIGMCSAMMLPMGTRLYNQFLEAVLEKNIEIHCLFEDMCLKSRADFNRASELMTLRMLADRVDKNSQTIKEFINAEMTRL